MYSHCPPNYICPFCLLVKGTKNIHVDSEESDIIYKSTDITAFIASRQWPNNHGHVLIIPNDHYENIYSLPTALATAIHCASKYIALAMKKAYNCSGISLRQHNEPSGNQDVWHYHLHLFPRYPDDQLYALSSESMATSERLVFATRLKRHLQLAHKDAAANP